MPSINFIIIIIVVKKKFQNLKEPFSDMKNFRF